MVHKVFLTEDEYDELNYHAQIDYKYCPLCGMFYAYDIIDNCGHPYGFFGNGGVSNVT